MLMLIKYELKKILGNRAGMVACTLALCFLVGLPLLQYLMLDRYEGGRLYHGLDVVEFEKQRMNSHAGPVTAERALEAHEALLQAEETLSVEIDEVTGEPLPVDDAAARQARAIMVDGYYEWANSLIMGEDDVSMDMEANVKANLEDSLNTHYFGARVVEYTQAERDFWMGMADGISWPLSYGYTGPWKNVLMNSLMLGIGVLAVCVALSGVFSGEYQAKTAAIMLPTARGKSMLPWAKVVAAFIFVSLYWLFITAGSLGAYVAMCGVDGWDLPYQLSSLNVESPYPLTLSHVVLFKYLLGYVMVLGVSGVTLLLSSKMRSALPVALTSVALVLMGVLAEVMNTNPKVYALTPFSALTHVYEWLLSYDFGGFVVDLPSVAMVLYLVLFAICVPVSTLFFRRHQVA